MQRIRAAELLEYFDVIRVAVNAEGKRADEFREALAKRAGRSEPETPTVTIATNEDLAAFLAGR